MSLEGTFNRDKVRQIVIADVMLVCMLFATALIAAGCGKTQDMETQGWQVQQIRACEGSDKHDCIGLIVDIDKDLHAQGEPITVTATTVAYDVYEDMFGPGAVDVSELRFSRDYVGRSFGFDLVDEQGQAISLTDQGARLQRAEGPKLWIEYNRDSSQPKSFQLDTLFELSEPGVYTLTLKQYFTTLKTFNPPDEIENEVIEIVGNPVTFTRLP